MGNPKSENRWREYHLMSVGENQFRCSVKNRISAGKTLFPGNSIIFATPPPPLFPPLRQRFRGNRNSIRAFKSADSFIRQDRFHRHRLFELKRAARRFRLRRTYQSARRHCWKGGGGGREKVSRCSKINRDTSVKRICGTSVVRK